MKPYVFPTRPCNLSTVSLDVDFSLAYVLDSATATAFAARRGDRQTANKAVLAAQLAVPARRGARARLTKKKALRQHSGT